MRRSPPLAASLTALALSLAASRAHSAAITGRFRAAEGDAPLPWVTVVLRSAADSTIVAHAPSDSSGRFRIAGLAPRRYLLRATLLGYKPWVRTDVAIADSAATLDLGTIGLEVAPIAIAGTQTNTARGMVQVTSDRNIYQAKDLPGASTGGTTDLLRQVPELDIDVVDEHVSLRGSSSVTIQINGRTSPLKGDALTTFLRQFPANRVERIEVVANPSAKYDPEGMAGIVNIVTKEALDLGLSGSFYATAGNRNLGSGSRLAWQKGKLTLTGGVSSYWMTYAYGYDDHRENLLAQPRSIYDLRSRGEGHGAFGGLDGSGEYAFDKRSTLYGTATGYLNRSRYATSTGYRLSDATPSVLSSWDLPAGTHSDWHSATASLGFTHVIEKSRNEWTVELRSNASPSTNTSDAAEIFSVPADSTGAVSLVDTGDHPRERSVQLDDTYPVGKVGKLETGYRGAERRSHATSSLFDLTGGALGASSEYVHREIFQSGYLTLGNTFGKFSVQGGVRGEMASTTFDVLTRAAHYDNDYRSVFPSANAAWDFGAGRTLRLTYSKRIERPAPFYLNPDVPTIDSLNRTVGNPALTPKFTHSYSLDATWTGSRGLLKFSPFYRRTVDNWDLFKTVDATGTAVSTWRNASSVGFAGATVIASLRQAGRFGGTATMSVYRERHDASNFTSSGVRSLVTWSLDGNVSYKATKKLDLQSFTRYRPAQTLAQGRQSSALWLNFGARYKLSDSAWLNANVSDPFLLWRSSYSSSDESYVQNGRNYTSSRRFGIAGGWSWGKPPEQKAPRRPSEDAAPAQDQPGAR